MKDKFLNIISHSASLSLLCCFSRTDSHGCFYHPPSFSNAVLQTYPGVKMGRSPPEPSSASSRPKHTLLELTSICFHIPSSYHAWIFISTSLHNGLIDDVSHYKEISEVVLTLKQIDNEVYRLFILCIIKRISVFIRLHFLDGLDIHYWLMAVLAYQAKNILISSLSNPQTLSSSMTHAIGSSLHWQR